MANNHLVVLGIDLVSALEVANNGLGEAAAAHGLYGRFHESSKVIGDLLIGDCST